MRADIWPCFVGRAVGGRPIEAEAMQHRNGEQFARPARDYYRLTRSHLIEIGLPLQLWSPSNRRAESHLM
jgi:hypothetical protein